MSPPPPPPSSGRGSHGDHHGAPVASESELVEAADLEGVDANEIGVRRVGDGIAGELLVRRPVLRLLGDELTHVAALVLRPGVVAGDGDGDGLPARRRGRAVGTFRPAVGRPVGVRLDVGPGRERDLEGTRAIRAHHHQVPRGAGAGRVGDHRVVGRPGAVVGGRTHRDLRPAGRRARERRDLDVSRAENRGSRSRNRSCRRPERSRAGSRDDWRRPPRRASPLPPWGPHQGRRSTA